ncbi:MAG: DNA polymerase III subunit alpha [Burkholderiales bacterium]|nr:DNA polymerase III subunit alpha [Burkholderiales bacterium]
MPAPRFVHLRLHSEYSVADGMVRVDAAAQKARDDAMPALALTDLDNCFAWVKFHQAARAAGVQPVAGVDVRIANPADRDRGVRVVLLAQDRTGWLRLNRWLTRAYREHQWRGRPELDAAWFDADGTDGLIVLTGGHDGPLAQPLLAGRGEAADAAAVDWARWFPDRCYVEVQRAGHADAAQIEDALLDLAARRGLPPVATHPVQFLVPDEFEAHEARVCIAEGHVLSDTRRPKRFTPQQWFRTQDEMAAAFADLPEALANSVEIARRCSFTLDTGRTCLPAFPTPRGEPLDVHMHDVAQAGLERRLDALYPDPTARAEAAPRYAARLDFELKTIVKMGFPGYFLIVADFINWAKSNGVPVGPGRGSGAGSLVAYALGITDLDPLRYDLLFERFLNPERVSMPDFDVDFCQDGRDRVIDYVRRRYGAASVSQIATFGTMAAKAVVRDVGRVMDWGYGRTDELAKLIPFQPGKLITLAMAREMEPRLAERERNEEETRELLALAGRLEGLVRNVGMHAGGVLIAPGELTDFCPLYCAAGHETSVVSQFDKDDVEAVGLVKFDFLGLTTLTILDWTLRFVKRLDPAAEIALDTLPLDDPQAYRVFASGNTSAVFQFESTGMRELLTRARPDRFEDIIALVALYRPGPMDLIPDFIERKRGKRFEYLHPLLEPVLEPTYGIMVYQEQVMQAAQVCAGYSLGGADLLRRAMGKKKPEEMAKQREIFVAGAAAKGIGDAKANEIFDYMEKFAGYGFNKSHAAAYALVAYQTAWFKAHHVAAFMAANLSAVMDDTDKVQALFDDARANGLDIRPPDVNTGHWRFEPVDRSTLRYGLGAIKGSGETAIAHVVQVRTDGGPFVDLFDFCRRVDAKIVNRRVVEALVKAGAFDAIDPQRARLFASVGVALGAAEQAVRSAHQDSLFGGVDAPPAPPVQAVEVAPWSEHERLQHEKTALGFYLSGHPFTTYAAEFAPFVRTPLARLQPPGWDEGGARTTWVAGVVESLRFQKTANGRMIVVMLSDGTARQEVTVYSEIFDAVRDRVKEDAVLVIEAKLRAFRRGGDDAGSEPPTVTLRVIAERIFDVAGARAHFARGLRIAMNGEADAQRLRTLLTPYRAERATPIVVEYRNRDARCELVLGDDWRVRPEDPLVRALHDWLRPENVRFVYAATEAAPPPETVPA